MIMSSYAETYRRSLQKPEEFWAEAAEAIEWERRWDRVLIYMPMVPEAAIAMLACARIGAIHSVVFGGFASHELATRIDDAKPIAIVSASCGVEINRVIPYKPLLAAAIEEARSKPKACVILQRPMCRAEMVAGRDHDWQELDAKAPPVDCVPL